MNNNLSKSIAVFLLVITIIGCGQSQPTSSVNQSTDEATSKPTETNPVAQPSEPIRLPLIAQWEQWNFVIQKADAYTSLDEGKVKPDNDLFLALVGELENNSGEEDCWTTINWELINTETGKEYDFAYDAATPLESIYGLDTPGVLFGTCVDSGEKQPLFVVFDVEQDAELALTLYEGQPIELSTANYLASVPTATPTITPTPTDTPIAADTPTPTNTSAPTDTPQMPTDTPMPSLIANSVTEAVPTPTPVCPNPQIQINSPAPGTRFTSRYVLISGNANIPNFNYYKFEYSTDPNSSNWNYLLQQNTPVENGKLMELDTTTIPPGPYGLRLTVVDQTGNYPEPCVVWFNTLVPSEVSVPTTVRSQPLPAPATPSGSSSVGCCKHCGPNSKACGDSCISLSYTCRKGPGCACD